MKLLFTFITFLSFHLASAVPHQPFTAEEVTGVVESGVWRSAVELNRVFAAPKGEPQNESLDTVPEHWIIILKDPKGLTDQQRMQISWAYSRLPIDQAWRNFTRNLQDTHLYLWISAPKDWPVKVGSSITVKGLEYGGMDFEGWYTVDEVLIDGIPVELPKEQNLPSWKSVENGTSEQPTIKPATETDVGK